MVERTVSEQEMVDILEDIARNGGNAAAKIAAIKELRAMSRAEAPGERDRGVMDAPARRTSHLKAA